jgi:tRNA threonylcarbamoyladenosine biosynthesis protein TsaB
MIILTIRTDKPEAEIGLYQDTGQLAYEVWPAGRQLSVQIHTKIREMLQSQGYDWTDLDGIVCFKGPGSFTGLRIGLSVANGLAYGLQIPIVAEKDAWIEQGIERLMNGSQDRLALPEYGRPAHITQSKK